MKVRTKSRRRAFTARSLGGPSPLTDATTYQPVHVRRQGITRRPARYGQAAGLPLSDRHKEVLAVLREQPCGAALLSALCGLKDTQVTSACYALAARGLAEHIHGKGWKLV